VELHILSKCDHRNIVKLIGSWKKGEETFIAIEWCGGGAVSDFAVWGFKLTEPQISFIIRETLRGLKYLHDNKIIHRDIKGANILVTDEGEVKLIDFGVSAILKSHDEKRKTLIGTPYWMAPEIISNKTRYSPYDNKVDIWSVGITIIELAEKDPPLAQMNPMRALMQIPLRESPKLAHPQKWSSAINDFVTLCLQKDCRKRPSVDELLTHAFVNKTHYEKILLDVVHKAQKEREKLLQDEKREAKGQVSTSQQVKNDPSIDNITVEKPTNDSGVSSEEGIGKTLTNIIEEDENSDAEMNRKEDPNRTTDSSLLTAEDFTQRHPIIRANKNILNNRPTMSAAMATKQSQALQNVNGENSKLIKQQLKDMRAHVQKQNLELERLKARHK